MQPTLAVFDLDGTLIDSAGDIRHALNLLLSELGCEPLPLNEVRQMIGDGATRLIERALAARQRTVPDVHAALQHFLELYAADPVARTQIYPGVSETLQRLQDRGVLMAVCTNKPFSLSETILARLGLDRYFASVLGGDSLPYRKPDPRMLLQQLQQFDVPPERAVLVGDSEIDAATAQGAGVSFVLVTYGYHRTPLDSISRQATVDDFAGVADFIPLPRSI